MSATGTSVNEQTQHAVTFSDLQAAYEKVMSIGPILCEIKANAKTLKWLYRTALVKDWPLSPSRAYAGVKLIEYEYAPDNILLPFDNRGNLMGIWKLELASGEGTESK